jgi:hypothetical protein
MKRIKPRSSVTNSGFIFPPVVDKKFARHYLTSPSLVDRMLWATRYTDDPWLEIVLNREGSCNAQTLIYSGSLDLAVERLRRGEEPPHLPSKSRPQTTRRKKAA